MNYYPFHVGDYISHTAHLEPMEDLAYRRMLDACYMREGSLPADPAEVARLIRLKDEVVTVERLLCEFFKMDDTGWCNERCNAEIAKFGSRRVKAKESAQASVAARKAKSQRTLNERSTTVELPEPEPEPELIHSLLSKASPRPKTEESDLLGDLPKGEEPYEPPACPHLEVLKAWAEVMPDLPQHLPEMWKGTRADHLRARWRETAVLKHWTTPAEGLAYFRKFFGWVRQSPFLMGKVAGKEGRAFDLELAWLVNPTNWAKSHEGKYHG